MEAQELNRTRIINDRAAAAALGDPFLRRLVLKLVTKERSVGELAAASQLEPKRLHYHVTRLCRLGLLYVAGERKRAGRAIKLYRSTSARYFIPSEIASEPLSEALAREMRSLLMDEHVRAGDGVLLETDEQGAPRMQLVSEPEGGAIRASESWQILRLTQVEAAALRRDLRSEVARHAARATGRGKPYLVHVAIARRTAATVSVDNPRTSQLPLREA